LRPIIWGKNGARIPTDRRFQFQKHRQFFIGVHDEVLSVVAVRVNNPDCLPFKIRSALVRAGGRWSVLPCAAKSLTSLSAKVALAMHSAMTIGSRAERFKEFAQHLGLLGVLRHAIHLSLQLLSVIGRCQ